MFKITHVDVHGNEFDLSDRLTTIPGSGVCIYQFLVGSIEFNHFYPCSICNPIEYKVWVDEGRPFQLLYS
jgi:hypothetical protein